MNSKVRNFSRGLPFRVFHSCSGFWAPDTDCGLDNFTIFRCRDIEGEALIDTLPVNALHADTSQMSEIRKPSPATSGVFVPPTATPSISPNLGPKRQGHPLRTEDGPIFTLSHRQFVIIPPRTSTWLEVTHLRMAIPSCRHHWPAPQRRDKEPLLAAVDVEALVGRDVVAAQAAFCPGSGFPPGDVQRMSSLGQRSVVVVTDGGAFRNN